jgi:hypothetical protein
LFFFGTFCLVALPRYLALLFQGLKLLPCRLIVPCATSSRCLIALFHCLTTSLPFATWLLSHLKYLLIPPHLLFCYLVVLLFIASLPCCLVALCWLVLPFSFTGRILELGEEIL